VRVAGIRSTAARFPLVVSTPDVLVFDLDGWLAA
jgi:hypothetical protein